MLTSKNPAVHTKVWRRLIESLRTAHLSQMMVMAMRHAGLALLITFYALATGNVASAEPYRYGNLVANIGPEWSPAPLTSPGNTLVTFRRQTDDADAGPGLFWLEMTPLSDVSLRKFVQSAVQAIGMPVNARQLDEAKLGAYQLVFDSTIQKTSVRASFYSYRRGQQLYLLGFIASPQTFDALQGDKLPQSAFLNGYSPSEFSNGDSQPSPDHVLVRAGDHKLTQKMVTDTLALAELLAATAISDSDHRELRQEIIDDFASSSPEDLEGYRQIGTLMDGFAAANAIKRAEIRRDMRARIWFDSQKLDEVSPIVELVDRYNPVLGADASLGLVATRSAFDALLASNSFVASRAGMQPYARPDRDQFADQIKKTYSTLNEKQKRYLSNGEVSWLKLISVWQTWNVAAQNKHLGIVGVGGIKTPEQVSQVARNLEHWAGIDASSQQLQKLVGMQGDMMVLQHLRGLLGTDGSN